MLLYFEPSPTKLFSIPSSSTAGKVQYRTVGFAGAFGRSERQRNILGLLDAKDLNYDIPEHWRYIIVRVAKK